MLSPILQEMLIKTRNLLGDSNLGYRIESGKIVKENDFALYVSSEGDVILGCFLSYIRVPIRSPVCP